MLRGLLLICVRMNDGSLARVLSQSARVRCLRGSHAFSQLKGDDCVGLLVPSVDLLEALLELVEVVADSQLRHAHDVLLFGLVAISLHHVATVHISTAGAVIRRDVLRHFDAMLVLNLVMRCQSLPLR